MKIFADENLPKNVVRWLRDGGHDVLYAAEAKPGTPDPEWLTTAQLEERVILTADKDFGELIFRDNLNSHGVLLLRLDECTTQEILARLTDVWSVVEANPSRRFIVVTENKVRVRPLPSRS